MQPQNELSVHGNTLTNDHLGIICHSRYITRLGMIPRKKNKVAWETKIYDMSLVYETTQDTLVQHHMDLFVWSHLRHSYKFLISQHFIPICSWGQNLAFSLLWQLAFTTTCSISIIQDMMRANKINILT